VVLAVAACIPSNLGVRFTLVLHDRSAPQQALEPMFDRRVSNRCSTRSTPDPWRPGTRGGPEERDPDTRSQPRARFWLCQKS
jgi:hypothetical protein